MGVGSRRGSEGGFEGLETGSRNKGLELRVWKQGSRIEV